MRAVWCEAERLMPEPKRERLRGLSLGSDALCAMQLLPRSQQGIAQRSTVIAVGARPSEVAGGDCVKNLDSHLGVLNYEMAISDFRQRT